MPKGILNHLGLRSSLSLLVMASQKAINSQTRASIKCRMTSAKGKKISQTTMMIHFNLALCLTLERKASLERLVPR